MKSETLATLIPRASKAERRHNVGFGTTAYKRLVDLAKRSKEGEQDKAHLTKTVVALMDFYEMYEPQVAAGKLKAKRDGR